MIQAGLAAARFSQCARIGRCRQAGQTHPRTIVRQRELSVFLARTQAVATNPAALDTAVQLRHAAETVPVTALTFVVVRALGLLDGLCWDSLERGDSIAFVHQAALGAELQQFGTCAGLLPED